MAAVEMLIRSIVVTSARLRPIRSPMCPKTPPSGRATKPTKNVVKARIVGAVAFSVGKNSLSNTRPAAVLRRKKPYHSTVVPMRLGTMTVRTFFCCACPVSGARVRRSAVMRAPARAAGNQVAVAGGPPGRGRRRSQVCAVVARSALEDSVPAGFGDDQEIEHAAVGTRSRSTW